MAETKRSILERIDLNTIAIRMMLREMHVLVVDLHDLGERILRLTRQTKEGMTMANQAIQELTEQFNLATNEVSARIDRLTQGLENVATPEQIAELTAIKDRLAQLGADPNNPVPVAPAFRR